MKKINRYKSLIYQGKMYLIKKKIRFFFIFAFVVNITARQLKRITIG